MIGETSVFAVESGTPRAYERLNFRALGFFVIYVGGRCYGKRAPDSTMLACPYDEVERRIAMRRRYIVPFGNGADAGTITDASRNAVYAEEQRKSRFRIPLSEFRELTGAARIMWEADGDEAFDDGSHVLQFDVQDRVRLIAFKSRQSYLHEPVTLSDIWFAADDFYHVLQHWQDGFEVDWASTPKVSA
jgi:hypothetical protein